MTKLLRFACLCTLLLLPAFLPAQSQITTGVMQGTILDPSGAVVSGAEVEIVNISTNLTKKLTTDGDGRFVALALQPGRYKVTVHKDGYTNLAYENVELTVGQSLYLSPKLSVAGGKETVVVTATPNLDPTKTESSSTLNEATVANTPVLGRKFEDLLTLTPGVSISQGPDGDEINFNGQRGIFNNISLDGGDYNNGFFGEQAGGQRAAIDITMEAVKEFQVVATGSNAEFGRTAGGVVNVITKSGTNDTHGSLFYYQRAEALSANQSDGTPLTDFNREQFGGSLGGALKKDKVFGFLAYEGIAGNLQRPNLSQPIGSTPCPVSAPVITADEAAISGNPDCQRLALVNFYDTTFGQDESLPVRRPLHNHALLGKLDWNINQANQFNFSYNFDASRKVNETFDVPTYGTSANGIEGTSHINGYRANLNTSITSNVLNEARFSYIHESRPRQASPSNVLADTAIGSAFTPTPFRFGNPFFVQPNVDETFWRTQIADNVSWVKGKHTIKVGGEWLHSLNSQVFRGFFGGRYIFSDVAAFLRYAQPEAPGGFGPSVEGCTGGGFITTSLGETCATSSTGTPLLLYLQGANQDLSPATDATGASSITNQDFALFIQDKWQIHPRLTLNYGLRWEAQIFPDPTTPPSGTVYGPFLSNPDFPSDGTIPNQTKQFQPRIGLAWDIAGNQKSVFRSSFGIYNARQNMLTQISAITTNGVQQATVALGPFVPSTILPAYPGLFAATPLPPGEFPLFSGVHVFDRDYHNPRVYTANFGYEQQLARDMVFYSDFTWSKAVFLTNILNYGRGDRASFFPFLAPTLGDVLVHSSRANSLYRGLTMGIRKSYSHNFQMDANYTYAQDWDNDSNERDPFTDRSGPASATDPFPLRNDYSPSDRDIRHRFNFIMTGDMPWGFQGNMRFQAHSAQPLTGPDGRNTLRKDNVYASMDWRLSRPFKFHDRFALIPTMEMFNTFNSDNNIIPESTSPLFNFQGFVRQGLGDPRQLQLALRFTF